MSEKPFCEVVMLQDYQSSDAPKEKDGNGKLIPQYRKGKTYPVDWATYRCLFDHLRIAEVKEKPSEPEAVIDADSIGPVASSLEEVEGLNSTNIKKLQASGVQTLDDLRAASDSDLDEIDLSKAARRAIAAWREQDGTAVDVPEIMEDEVS